MSKVQRSVVSVKIERPVAPAADVRPVSLSV
jgi:hypothetical protein